jgi:hypothetical protein
MNEQGGCDRPLDEESYTGPAVSERRKHALQRHVWQGKTLHVNRKPPKAGFCLRLSGEEL